MFIQEWGVHGHKNLVVRVQPTDTLPIYDDYPRWKIEYKKRQISARRQADILRHANAVKSLGENLDDALSGEHEDNEEEEEEEEEDTNAPALLGRARMSHGSDEGPEEHKDHLLSWHIKTSRVLSLGTGLVGEVCSESCSAFPVCIKRQYFV